MDRYSIGMGRGAIAILPRVPSLLPIHRMSWPPAAVVPIGLPAEGAAGRPQAGLEMGREESHKGAVAST